MEITMIGSYLFSNFTKHFSVHAGNYNCIKISLLVFWSASLTESPKTLVTFYNSWNSKRNDFIERENKEIIVFGHISRTQGHFFQV